MASFKDRQYRVRSRSFDNSALDQYINNLQSDYSQENQNDNYQSNASTNMYAASSGQSTSLQYQRYQSDEISSTPFQKPLTPLTGQRTGWLTKMGHIVPSWKSRWFVLNDGKLYYYSSNTDASTLKGTVDVRGGTVDNASSYVNKLNCFHIQSPTGKHLYAFSKDPVDSQNWIEALCTHGGAKQVEPAVKSRSNTTATKSTFTITTNNNDNSESFRSNTITSTYQPPPQERGRPRSQSDPMAPQPFTQPPRPSFAPPPRSTTNAPPPTPQRALPPRTQTQSPPPRTQTQSPPPRTQTQAPPPSAPFRPPATSQPPVPQRQPISQAPVPSRQPVSNQKPFAAPAKQTTIQSPPVQRKPASQPQQKACPYCGTMWELSCQFCGNCGNRF